MSSIRCWKSSPQKSHTSRSTVANTSGMVSTASSRPSGPTGSPIAAVTVEQVNAAARYLLKPEASVTSILLPKETS